MKVLAVLLRGVLRALLLSWLLLLICTVRPHLTLPPQRSRLAAALSLFATFAKRRMRRSTASSALKHRSCAPGVTRMRTVQARKGGTRHRRLKPILPRHRPVQLVLPNSSSKGRVRDLPRCTAENLKQTSAEPNWHELMISARSFRRSGGRAQPNVASTRSECRR